MTELKRLLNEIPKHTRLRWRIQMAITEFIWGFHPRRNRWCDKCGDFIGNSKKETEKHECDEMKAQYRIATKVV